MRYRNTSVVCFTLALLISTSARADEPAKTTLLQGTWEISGYDTLNPQATGPRKGTFVVNGAEFAITVGNRKMTGTFSIDPTKTPAHIDLNFDAGNGAVLAVKGIYKLTEKSLTICEGGPKEPRPTKFGTVPGREYSVLTLKKPEQNPE